jgi:hypothetical protein
MIEDYDKWKNKLLRSFKILATYRGNGSQKADLEEIRKFITDSFEEMLKNPEGLESYMFITHIYEDLVNEATIKINDKRIYQTLFSLLYDALDDSSLQEHIINTILSKAPDLSIPIIAEELPALYQRSPFWAEEFLHNLTRLKNFQVIFEKKLTEPQKSLMRKIAGEIDSSIVLPAE